MSQKCIPLNANQLKVGLGDGSREAYHGGGDENDGDQRKAYLKPRQCSENDQRSAELTTHGTDIVIFLYPWYEWPQRAIVPSNEKQRPAQGKEMDIRQVPTCGYCGLRSVQFLSKNFLSVGNRDLILLRKGTTRTLC